ncbi:DivIVA domain-containing protein [Clostridium cylindrosporum]|uniref:Cell division initiation protein DivIVA n=1 Tax=Clostridium cylindrosporum DSM 605 TaxID=1121307 RepID=A0A0J8DAU5_CLOCY|nr:DivIVA domain-containing protein [Clostridium cylindrosporum]KMT21434.1 cell division initiation protein DivIVA [Clostridium cylindrosporum DSM 605]
MTITPNEISNKDFKKNFRGYDMDEVDTFLDAIREDYEKIYKNNSALKEQVLVLKEKVDHYTNMENTLQNTLILAQTAAQQAKENSQKEASIVMKDAERQAEIIIKEAEKRISEINKEYEFIKQQFNAFKSRFKGMVESQLETIEKIEIETGIAIVSSTTLEESANVNKSTTSPKSASNKDSEISKTENNDSKEKKFGAHQEHKKDYKREGKKEHKEKHRFNHKKAEKVEA